MKIAQLIERRRCRFRRRVRTPRPSCWRSLRSPRIDRRPTSDGRRALLTSARQGQPLCLRFQHQRQAGDPGGGQSAAQSLNIKDGPRWWSTMLGLGPGTDVQGSRDGQRIDRSRLHPGADRTGQLAQLHPGQACPRPPRGSISRTSAPTSWPSSAICTPSGRTWPRSAATSRLRPGHRRARAPAEGLYIISGYPWRTRRVQFRQDLPRKPWGWTIEKRRARGNYLVPPTSGPPGSRSMPSRRSSRIGLARQGRYAQVHRCPGEQEIPIGVANPEGDSTSGPPTTSPSRAVDRADQGWKLTVASGSRPRIISIPLRWTTPRTNRSAPGAERKLCPAGWPAGHDFFTCLRVDGNQKSANRCYSRGVPAPFRIALRRSSWFFRCFSPFSVGRLTTWPLLALE